jgi:hypothetical protein
MNINEMILGEFADDEEVKKDLEEGAEGFNEEEEITPENTEIENIEERVRVSINVLKIPGEDKHCVEMTRLDGGLSAYIKVYKRFQKFMEETYNDCVLSVKKD